MNHQPTTTQFIARLLISAGMVLCSSASAQESQYFRKDSGVLADQTLPDDFSKAELKWRTPLPGGISTPCVVGDRVLLTTWDADKSELATVALDRKSGKQLWKQISPVREIEQVHPVGNPASASPASNGRQVFCFFGSYGLLCYDLDGKLLWKRELGPFQDEFGASSSPVLADGMVVLNEDHDVDSFLIAIDQKTGKTVWRAPRDEFSRSYSTPVIVEHEGRKQVVVAGSLQLACYDLATGKKLWWVNSLSRIVDPTPNVRNGVVYIASWTPGGDATDRISMEPFDEALENLDENNDQHVAKDELPEGSPVIPRFFRMDLDQDGKLNKSEWERHAQVFARAKNVAMAVRTDGRGDVTNSHVKWVHRKSLPTVPSAVVYEGVMYMVKDSGIITALDADNGEVLKQGRAKGPGNYYASLVAGDGKIFLCSERGVITVLKAGRSWEVLNSHDFKERIMATPIARNGQMMIRTDEAIYSYTK